MTISIKRRELLLDLLVWYNNQNINFPWRNTNDPYSIWISEVMLQQTRISTVVPYYRLWLSVFPNIESVAKSNIDNILKIWEGLGYYRRAHNFHRACKIIYYNYSGQIPKDPSEFLKLPGVGPYINSAVMSIAFKIPLPAIDVNAIRVVSRLNSINIPFPQSKNIIFSFLQNIIDKHKPGDFNQAIMDFGREICSSNSAKCSICPLTYYCKSYVNNSVDKYPIKINKNNRPHYSVGVARETFNIAVLPVSFIKKYKHTYTHFSITAEAYQCRFIGGTPRACGCVDYNWIYPYETSQFAFHRLNHKLFDEIEMDSTV